MSNETKKRLPPPPPRWIDNKEPTVDPLQAEIGCDGFGPSRKQIKKLRKARKLTKRFCHECFYWNEKDSTCRKKAPHLSTGMWPVVSADDWCGEHAL